MVAKGYERLVEIELDVILARKGLGQPLIILMLTKITNFILRSIGKGSDIFATLSISSFPAFPCVLITTENGKEKIMQTTNNKDNNNHKKIVEHLVEAGKVLITIIIPTAVNWLLKIILGKRK